MRKIGLCCCYRHRNYGSQLQSYATTVEMRSRGVDCEVIQYRKKFTLKFMAETRIWTLPFNTVFVHDTLRQNRRKLMFLLHSKEKQLNAVRTQKINEFSKTHFTNLSRLCIGHDELKALGASYAGVFVGSDQLWSPSGITGNFHNLMFVPDSVPKFSYAASFGVSEIPRGKRKLYTTFLNRLSYISVREINGQRIVRQLTDREACVVADPVMLLTTQQWDKEIPYMKMYDRPYIFAYFLGTSEEHRRQANELGRLTGLPIISVRHMDSYNKCDEDFGDYAPYDVGPAEFLNLIRGACYVCTDSFHGSVFSMLYHKQLMIFRRYSDGSKTSKNSRIDSLCENLGIQDRCFNGSNIKDIMIPVDFDAVDKNIERIRRESKEFLDKALAFYWEQNAANETD